jgi:RHS repeat-associated protein
VAGFCVGAKERATELPSGIVAMGARVYDPYTGTFTQPDPILGGGANAYGYANGDPVNHTDLSGKTVSPACAYGKSGWSGCVKQAKTEEARPELSFSKVVDVTEHVLSNSIAQKVATVIAVAVVCAPTGPGDPVCAATIIGAVGANAALDRDQTALGNSVGNSASAFNAAAGCLDPESVACGVGLFGAVNQLVTDIDRAH